MWRDRPPFAESLRARPWALLLLAVVVAWPAAGAQDDEPPAEPGDEPAVEWSFHFPQEPFDLRPGADPATYGFAVSAERSPAPEGDWPALALEDVGGEGPERLEVEFAAAGGRPGAKAGTRSWDVVLTVRGMELESELTRTVRLSLGDEVSATLPYTLSNQTDAAVSWTLSEPPASMALGRAEADRRMSIAVTTEDRPTTVRLIGASLRDASTERVLGSEHLQLAGSAAGGEVAWDVPRHATATATLEFVDVVFPGKYEGELTFAADGSTEHESATLVVYYTTVGHQVLGFACILLGVLVSILVGVFVPNRIQRIEAERQAGAVARRLEPLRKIAEEARRKHPIPTIEETIRETGERLATSHLRSEGLLPALWAIDGESAKARQADFEAHLTKQAQIVAHLAVIVDHGVETLLRNDAASAAALQQLDGLAPAELLAAKELEDTRAEVTAILTPLLARAQAARGAGAELERRIVAIETLQGGLWAVWAVITAVAGWAALILTDPGFGTGTDLVTCFFWGLGIQAVGGQLQQLTPGKVASRFSLELPGESP